MWKVIEMNDDCYYQLSCDKCRHKCKNYIDYIKEKESNNLMQGEDRQPLVRRRGALGRK